MPYFKPSEDFLRFLTMGAAGSIGTLEDLQSRHGHIVVPLERATTSNKLWATKLKRLRLPDLLCTSCGLRVESRAKTDLAIKVSESASGTEGRNWDYGLRDRDLIALMRWDPETKQVSEPRYFRVGALKEAQDIGGSTLGPPKSARDAAERDRKWIAKVPGRDGRVVELSADGHTLVTRIATIGGAERSQRYSVPTSLPAHLYVRPGERFTGLEDFVIGVVEPPAPHELDCPGMTWDYGADLDDADDVTRYIAVRAAGMRAEPHVPGRLEETAATDTSFRIRLEALASLVHFDADAYIGRLIEFLSPTTATAYGDDTAALVLEAIFILTEIGSDAAIEALLAVARDSERPAETRAAAVWGLRDAEPERVIEFVADAADDVALPRDCGRRAARYRGADAGLGPSCRRRPGRSFSGRAAYPTRCPRRESPARGRRRARAGARVGTSRPWFDGKGRGSRSSGWSARADNRRGARAVVVAQRAKLARPRRTLGSPGVSGKTDPLKPQSTSADAKEGRFVGERALV